MYEPQKNEITAQAFYHYVKFIKDLESPTTEQIFKLIKKIKEIKNEKKL